MEEKEIMMWVTYHDDKQIDDYGLRAEDDVKLFKGNDCSVQGENINHLNKFYSEMVTFYYVWKNNKKSSLVGFEHYRRHFPYVCDVDEGQCQVLSILYNYPIFKTYKSAHNYQDLYDAVDILNEKYGEGNKYSKYLLEGNIFIPFCCFVMNYSDFEKLCEWLYSILFAWDKKNKLDMTPQKYMEKAMRDFRYDRINYQCRAISFLAERLISCYFVTEMKPFCITAL